MTEVILSRNVEAAPSAVWSRLADFTSHPTWMKDARAVTITSPESNGVGTTMEVSTRVGPFAVVDVLEVIGWVEGRSIRVAHTGLVQGVGELSVDSRDHGCVVSWSETLRFPWWLGGVVAAWLARPILKRVWAKNLDRLAAMVE